MYLIKCHVNEKSIHVKTLLKVVKDREPSVYRITAHPCQPCGYAPTKHCGEVKHVTAEVNTMGKIGHFGEAVTICKHSVLTSLGIKNTVQKQYRYHSTCCS